MLPDSSRRKWLELCAAGTVAGLAGCTSLFEDSTGVPDTDTENTSDPDKDDSPDDGHDHGPNQDDGADDPGRADEDDAKAQDNGESAEEEAPFTVSIATDRVALLSNPHLYVLEATAYPEGSDLEWLVGTDVIAEDERAVIHGFESAGEHEVRLRVTHEDETVEQRQSVEVTSRPASPPPLIGDSVPDLAVFDGIMLDTIEMLNSPGGALAASLDGELVLHRGYGWRDIDRTEAMTLESLFRIASLSKRLARAATYHLVEETDVEYDTRPFEYLDLEPLGGEVADDRIYDITVEQCLYHELGWDRDISGDPVFSQRDIAIDLELDRPPTPEEIVRHWMTVPLDFEPGAREAYSNIGYTVVEVLIEAETGSSFHEFLSEQVLDPLGIEDIRPGKNFPKDRPDREVEYDDDLTRPRVDVLDETEMVPPSDGGFNIESAGAPAGYIATPAAYLDFMTAYDIATGEPRDGQVDAVEYQGGNITNGTTALALQTDTGIDAVGVFNRGQRDIDPEEQLDVVLQTLEDLDVEQLREVLVE